MIYTVLSFDPYDNLLRYKIYYHFVLGSCASMNLSNLFKVIQLGYGGVDTQLWVCLFPKNTKHFSTV